MVWYVALIAVLNIGLGYGLAVYLGAAARRNPVTKDAMRSESYDELEDSDEYESDDGYTAEADEAEYESAAVG